MAKAGADVIKIEPPQGASRCAGGHRPGKSTTFPIAMLNSNKRAITLNLKHERGRALLREVTTEPRGFRPKPTGHRGRLDPAVGR